MWFSEEPAEVNPCNPDPIYLVSVQSPTDAELFVPPHCHPYTDEYFRCIAGQIHVTLDGVKFLFRPEDGEVKIARGAVHSLYSPKGDFVKFQEREEPNAVKKRDFLRNVALVSGSGSPLTLVKVLTLFYHDGDIVLPVVPGPKFLGKILLWVIGGFFGDKLGLGRFDYKSKRA